MTTTTDGNSGVKSKLVLIATVLSRVVAAYLLCQRGKSIVSIVEKTITNPIGLLITEVENAV